MVVTNATINRLYGTFVEESLLSEGFEVIILEVPDTEKSKSMEMASKLYDELMNHKVERTTPILALGGGVVGDLTGFVAATFLRGLPLIHIPTTLLAQVDSSIGGKTAVNLSEAKNMVGMFKHPELVLTDLDVLVTLPEKEIKNGVAEIIKYAVIADASLFTILENNINNILNPDIAFLEEIVSQCCKIKINVIERDEREIGIRKILNYGHTVGHGLEAVTDFTISHGEAVAVGMCAAARIANKIGIFDDGSVKKQENLIRKAGLPTTLPDINIEYLLRTMELDKKVKNSRIQFVLPEKIGSIVIRADIPQKDIIETLEELQ